jgi:hypothetical protein
VQQGAVAYVISMVADSNLMIIKRTRLRNLSVFFISTLNLSLGFVYLVFLSGAVYRDEIKFSDFSAFYTTGVMIHNGYAEDIYDVDLQREFQFRLLEGEKLGGGVLPFVYPPHVSLFFIPLAFLSRQFAFVMWGIIQLLFLIYLLRLIKQVLPRFSRNEYWLIWSAIVAFFPLFITFMNGTFSLIILICLLRIYKALKDEKDEKAGLWLAFGFIKPQFMALPGLALLIGRRWKSLFVTVLGGIVLAVISSWILGWKIWIDYFSFARSMTGYFGEMGFSPEFMYNLRGLLTIVLGYKYDGLINILSILGFICSAITTIWIWREQFFSKRADFELRLALTILLGIFFNLHLYPQDGLMLVAPVVIFLAYLRKYKHPLNIFATINLIFPSIFFLLHWTVPSGLFILVPISAMIALGIWIITYMYKEARLSNDIKGIVSDPKL